MFLNKDLKLESKKMDDDEYAEMLIKKDKILHIGLFIYSLSKLYMYKY